MTRSPYVRGTLDTSLDFANLLRQKLYHQTTAIRPKLIRLIEKYSQKKGMISVRYTRQLFANSMQMTSRS